VPGQEIALFVLTTSSSEAVARVLETLPGPTGEIAGVVTDATLSIALSGSVNPRSIAGHITSAASAGAVAGIVGGGVPGIIFGAAAGAVVDYLTNPDNAAP